MAQAALAFTMGLSWNASVKPIDAEVPYQPTQQGLDGLVNSTYQFSPDWGKLEAGLRALEGALRTARSGHYPKLALTGELHGWWNERDTGLGSQDNRYGWTVGVGMEIPLFDGFLTRGRVEEARARLSKVKEEKFLLKEGLGLQVRDLFLKLRANEASHQATLDA